MPFLSHRVTLVLGLCAAAAGFVWSLLPAQDADGSYTPSVAAPAYTRARPRVLVDEAHYNTHSAWGRLEPFTSLLMRDGYLVGASTTPLSDAALRRCTVLVVANPMGLRGLLQHVLNLAGLERTVALSTEAFTPAELDAVDGWVRGGGRLLLAADHAPAGRSAAGLAARFGVEMTNWWAEDPREHDRATGSISFLRFSRDNGLLADHPIINGRHEGERIDAVLTFTGQSLRLPAGAVSLLKLSPHAREYPFRRSRESEGRSAAGLSQAAAIEHGLGRVVVVGDAAALTAQVTRIGDAAMRIGLSRRDAQNQQFVLNAMHWLSGLL
jgi:hypothetical protein